VARAVAGGTVAGGTVAEGSLAAGSPVPRHEGGEGRVSELDWKIPMRSVMTPDRHLIVNLKSDRPELYALPEDAAETHDLAPERPGEVEALRRLLDDYERRREPRRADAIDALPPEQAERLRNLGYLH
jgi:hypothetical protein